MLDQHSSYLLKPQHMIGELLLQRPLLVHHVGSKLSARLGHSLLAAVHMTTFGFHLCTRAYVTSSVLYDCGTPQYHIIMKMIIVLLPRLTENKRVILWNYQKTLYLSNNPMFCGSGSNESGWRLLHISNLVLSSRSVNYLQTPLNNILERVNRLLIRWF